MSIVAKKIMMGSGAVALPSDDEFNRVSFLSHFDGANNGVNNAFDDGSTNNHTVTANGNVTQGSFGPFARPDGEFAVHFNGEGFYHCAADADFAFGTGDFCMEAWVFVDADAYNYSRVFCFGPYYNNNNSNGLTVDETDTGHKIRYYDYGNSFFLTSTTTTPKNTWFHVAVTKASNTVRLFINGTAEASGTNSNAPEASGTNTVAIGNAPDAGSGGEDFQGFISNARVVKGSAVYTSDFTPSTSKLTAITNTKLLTCQSNRFVDNSAEAHAITIGGAAGAIQVSAFGPFLTSAVYSAAVNGASAYFDGNGDYLSAEDDANFSFGTGDFTVECWLFHQNASATFYDIMGTANNSAYVGSNRGGWILAYYHTYGSGTYAVKFGYQYNNSFPVDVAFSKTLNADGWYHLTISRQGNQLKCFVNGIQAGSTVTNSTDMISTEPLIVGKGSGASNSGPMTGYICDARVVKGTAVYTGNFTPPTAPLTAITNTKLLLNMKDGQAIDSTAQNNLTLAGNAKLSTGQAKFGNTSMVFDGSGDYVTLPSSSFKPFGTGDFTIECFARFDAISGQGVFQLGASYLPSAIIGPAVFGTSDGGSARWRMYYATSYADNTSNPPSTNTWFHIAFVRASGVSKVYIDGVEVLSENDTTNYTNKFFVIGGAYSSSYLMDGYIDDFRISHFARYTSNNFTPPSAAFPDKGQ